jgi:hypothetical protein
MNQNFFSIFGQILLMAVVQTADASCIEALGGMREFLHRTQARLGVMPKPGNWNAYQLETAKEKFKSGGGETTDPKRKSAYSQLAMQIPGSDLFGGRFKGSIFDLMDKAPFLPQILLHPFYDRMYGNWWLQDTMDTSRSFSPVTKDLLRSNGDNPQLIRRRMFWPKNIIDANTSIVGKAHYIPDFSKYRVVLTEERPNMSSRDWQYHSAEVIAEDPQTKKFVPFYFLYVNGRWQNSLTFRGEPVERACLRCHALKENPTVLTPIPGITARKFSSLKRIGYSDLAASFLRKASGLRTDLDDGETDEMSENVPEPPAVIEARHRENRDGYERFSVSQQLENTKESLLRDARDASAWFDDAD